MINDFTKKEAPVLSTLGLGGGNASRLVLSSGPVGLATAVATRSLRLSSAYLTRTPSSEGNRKTWTWSGWVKRSGIGSNQRIFQARDANTGNQTFIQFRTDDKLYVGGNSDVFLVNTDSVFKDLLAWGNLTVRFDTTQSTAANRIRIYWNGVQQDLSGTQPTQDYATAQINSTLVHRIGNDSGGGSEYYDGYLSDVYLLDGTSVSPVDNFIELDSNGVYQSKLYNSKAYGTNGFHLNFDDATSTTTISADQSGVGNDYTTNSISVSAGADNDSLFDVPNNKSQTESGAGGQVSGNYCCLNPLHRNPSGNATATNGNLVWGGSDNNHHTIAGTFGVSSGKYYWEATMTATPTNYISIGMCKADHTFTNVVPGYDEDTAFSMLNTSGRYYYNSTSTSTYGTSWTTGDVIGVRYDEGKVYFYKNGTIMNASPILTLTGRWCPMFHTYDTGQWTVNFGQRPFVHSAPTNHKPLCTALLPTPTVSNPSDHFETKIFTGNGSTTTLTTGFSPDFIWLKSRESTFNHYIADTVRGNTKLLNTNTTSAEATSSTGVTSFNSDGVTLGSGSETNASGDDMVAWLWDAGTSTVSNTDGSITSQVRASQTCGVSIVTFTGTGANATVGHGLNAEPHMLLTKCRESGFNWAVYHKSSGNTGRLMLNNTLTFASGSTFWNNTTPTSSVFSVGSFFANNNTFLGICFAPVEGFSAFGSFAGNGNASNPPFVQTGFRPAWVMLRRRDNTGDWIIFDNKRNTSDLNGNFIEKVLYPNKTNAEEDGANGDTMLFLSNGFKLNNVNYAYWNASGSNYMWAAFAENPFQANGGIAR